MQKPRRPLSVSYTTTRFWFSNSRIHDRENHIGIKYVYISHLSLEILKGNHNEANSIWATHVMKDHFLSLITWNK